MSYPSAPAPGQPEPNRAQQPVPTGQPQPNPANPQGYGQYKPTGYQRPRPGIIPLGPLSLGDIFSGLFAAVSANPKVVFGLPLLIMVPVAAFFTLLHGILMLIPGINEYFLPVNPDRFNNPDLASGDDAALASAVSKVITSSTSSSLLISIGSFIATVFVAGMLTIVISQLTIGRKATIKQAWVAFKPRLWALVGYTILYSLITSAVILIAVGVWAAAMFSVATFSGDDSGAATAVVLMLLFGLAMLFAAIIFTFYISTKLLFGSCIVVLEEASPVTALKRSWSLTRGVFWRVLGISLLAGLLVGVASSVVTGPLTVLESMSTDTSLAVQAIISLVVEFITLLVSALLMPFSSGVSALLYLDARMRKENLAESLIAAASQNNPGPQTPPSSQF